MLVFAHGIGKDVFNNRVSNYLKVHLDKLKFESITGQSNIIGSPALEPTTYSAGINLFVQPIKISEAD